MNDLISVLVPIYNVEQYLVECIESIINQSYKNLEIVLVNDGSSDNCPKICDEYAKKDKRIKVIHQKNGGVSVARTVTLDNSTGKYIAFVDSDDSISVNFIEILYENLIKYNADTSVCNYFKIYTTVSDVTDESDETIKLYSNKEFMHFLSYKDGGYATILWNKLFKRELFEGIRFPVGRIHEDDAVTYRLLAKSNKVVETSKKLYRHYYRNSQSIMVSKFSNKRLDVYKSYDERLDFLKEFDEKLYKEFIVFYLSRIRLDYLLANNSKDDLKDCINYIANKHHIMYSLYKKEKVDTSTYNKCNILMFAYFRPFYLFLKNMEMNIRIFRNKKVKVI